MALDKDGFKRKTYDELLTDMSAKAKEHFGADANVSERAVLGILLRIMAWFLSLAWQAIEAVYHGGYRSSAEGVQLDKLLPHAGTRRNQADYATGELKIVGTSNATISAGFIGATSSGTTFETVDDCVLDDLGEGYVDIVCTAIGSIGNVAANSITVIENPNADVISITNLLATSGGREKETDSEAKDRADITVEGMGAGTTASIRAELLKIDGVRAAYVIENDTLAGGAYNTPPKAVQVFILGGNDEDIAQAILKKKTGGIQAYGSNVINAIDSAGYTHPIGFTRALEKRIYAKIELTTDVSFTATGENDVKNSLVSYIGGAKTDNSLSAGLSMGENAIYVKALTNIAKITGVVDVVLTLSADNITFNTDNITVNMNEVAQLDSIDIEVSYNV